MFEKRKTCLQAEKDRRNKRESGRKQKRAWEQGQTTPCLIILLLTVRKWPLHSGVYLYTYNYNLKFGLVHLFWALHVPPAGPQKELANQFGGVGLGFGKCLCFAVEVSASSS